VGEAKSLAEGAAMPRSCFGTEYRECSTAYFSNALALAEEAEGLGFIDRRVNDLTLLKRNH
jgi:hypothetical protein